MRYCVVSCIIIWDEETRGIYWLGSAPPGRDTDNFSDVFKVVHWGFAEY